MTQLNLFTENYKSNGIEFENWITKETKDLIDNNKPKKVFRMKPSGDEKIRKSPTKLKFATREITQKVTQIIQEQINNLPSYPVDEFYDNYLVPNLEIKVLKMVACGQLENLKSKKVLHTIEHQTWYAKHCAFENGREINVELKKVHKFWNQYIEIDLPEHGISYKIKLIHLDNFIKKFELQIENIPTVLHKENSSIDTVKVSKEQAKLAKQQEREAKKLAKEQEKLAKQQERKAKKLEKEQAKLAKQQEREAKSPKKKTVKSTKKSTSKIQSRILEYIDSNSYKTVKIAPGSEIHKSTHTHYFRTTGKRTFTMVQKMIDNGLLVPIDMFENKSIAIFTLPGTTTTSDIDTDPLENCNELYYCDLSPQLDKNGVVIENATDIVTRSQVKNKIKNLDIMSQKGEFYLEGNRVQYRFYAVACTIPTKKTPVLDRKNKLIGYGEIDRDNNRFLIDGNDSNITECDLWDIEQVINITDVSLPKEFYRCNVV